MTTDPTPRQREAAVHAVRTALLALTYTPGEAEQLLTQLTGPTAPVDNAWLAEIQARADAATPGPWCTDSWEIYQGAEYEPGISFWIGETCRAESMEQDRADAEFVAAARSDVPALVAEVQALHAEVDKLKRSAELAEEDYRRVVQGASQIEAGLRARITELKAAQATTASAALTNFAERLTAKAASLGGEYLPVDQVCTALRTVAANPTQGGAA